MSAASPLGVEGVAPRRTPPGWPEIFAGAAAYVIAIGVLAVTLPLVESRVASGIAGLFVSGVIGLVAFTIAVLIRSRSLGDFGIRRAPMSRILVGGALGIGAYLLGALAAVLYVVVTGDAQNIQDSYQAAAAGGGLALTLALIAGAVVTPLGEEAFFRGVLANGLLRRYRAWIGILLSAAIFAVAHGINPVLPVAFVVGVLTALLFRWSGSIWPGVALHAVNNATALLVPVIIAAISA